VARQPANRASLKKSMLAHHKAGQPTAGRLCDGHLTPREEEIIALLCAGCRPRQIALMLCIEICTVRSHLRTIMSKLDSRTQEQAVAIYVRRQTANPPQ